MKDKVKVSALKRISRVKGTDPLLPESIENNWTCPLCVRVTKIEVVLIRDPDQRTKCRTTQMGAMTDIRATLFESWIKHKRHRHPFRKETDADLPKTEIVDNANPMGVD